jgi:hypothetical protein
MPVLKGVQYTSSDPLCPNFISSYNAAPIATAVDRLTLVIQLCTVGIYALNNFF